MIRAHAGAVVAHAQALFGVEFDVDLACAMVESVLDQVLEQLEPQVAVAAQAGRLHACVDFAADIGGHRLIHLDGVGDDLIERYLTLAALETAGLQARQAQQRGEGGEQGVDLADAGLNGLFGIGIQ